MAGAALAAGLAGCQSLVGHAVPMSPNDPPHQPVAAAVIPAGATQPAQPAPPPKPGGPARLDIPWEFPGADATIPPLPPDTPETRPARLRAIADLFPDVTDLRPDPVVDPTPENPGFSLDSLTEQAKRNSPLLAQAAAEVAAARGRWVQAGLYPNPSFGFQGDQISDAGNPGQLGFNYSQLVILGGKLTLARNVAFYDYGVALVRLRRAEIDLERQVRADYFAVLVAAETVRLNRLMTQFTETVYRRQVDLVRGNTAAPYEAAALRVNVNQARLGVVQSRNRYVSAWKQMAATLNAPGLPLGPLAGRVDLALPHYAYDALRDLMLSRHTDLAVARQQVSQAEVSITRARRQVVPDLSYTNYFQHDNQLSSFQWGVNASFNVPVFDRNQGNIAAARADFARLSREAERVRNDLDRQLADAYERYSTARDQIELYRGQILPDLSRGFRGLYERYQVEPGPVNYQDLVTAQLNINAQVVGYLAALQQQWLAASDLAAAVQADRLEELNELPPCEGPGTWPEAAPLLGTRQQLPAPRPAPAPEKK